LSCAPLASVLEVTRVRFNKLVTLQQQDDETEQWSDVHRLHARVNKTGGGSAFNAGADQYNLTLTFELRHSATLEAVRYNPQAYRVQYRGHLFKITDYDDYMEQHRTVRLVGVLYG
jgi:SPP1 family predicted phage head-tail adaptor